MERHFISRRLSVCCARITMRGHRPSANAKGRSDSLSDLVFLYSRQHHSQTLRVCSVMFSWTFAVAPLAAAPRLLKGRSVGKALPHFRSEPYVALHPRRGFAYIRRVFAYRQRSPKACAQKFPQKNNLLTNSHEKRRFWSIGLIISQIFFCGA